MIKYSLRIVRDEASSDSERNNKEELCKMVLSMKEITGEKLKKKDQKVNVKC